MTCVEELVKKYSTCAPECSYDFDRYSAEVMLREALTELAAEHDRKQALLLEAHCERVSILQEPIRQLEAPDRFGGGVMTRRQANKLRRLIRAHTAAQVELSWAGAGDPTERGELEDEAKAAMTALEKFISELEVK